MFDIQSKEFISIYDSVHPYTMTSYPSVIALCSAVKYIVQNNIQKEHRM
jgi:hypothetical protein